MKKGKNILKLSVLVFTCLIFLFSSINLKKVEAATFVNPLETFNRLPTAGEVSAHANPVSFGGDFSLFSPFRTEITRITPTSFRIRNIRLCPSNPNLDQVYYSGYLTLNTSKIYLIQSYTNYGGPQYYYRIFDPNSIPEDGAWHSLVPFFTYSTSQYSTYEQFNFRIYDNQPPVFDNIDVSYNKTADRIEYDIDASDPNNDSLTYKVMVIGKTSWENTMAAGFISTEGWAEGTYYLAISIQDADEVINRSIKIIIDKTAPIAQTPTITVDSSSQITIASSADDELAGLHDLPYMYNRNEEDITDWITDNSYTDTELSPNTAYTYKYKVRDSVGNESWSNEITKYTLALDPEEVSITSKTAAGVAVSIKNNSSNGEIPETMLEVRQKSDGSLITSSDWSTDIERVLTGLTLDTEYELWSKTRNGDQVENEFVKIQESIFSNRLHLGEISQPTGDSIITEVTGQESIAFSGRVWDLDQDPLTVLVKIGDIEKTVEIINTPTSEPDEDNWSISFTGDDLPNNTYTGISIIVRDDKGEEITLPYEHSLLVSVARIARIEIEPVRTVNVGNAFTLTATGYFSDGSHRDISKEAIWTSLNPDLATVNQGTVVGISVGAATIEAELNGVTGTVLVEVIPRSSSGSGSGEQGATTHEPEPIPPEPTLPEPPIEQPIPTKPKPVPVKISQSKPVQRPSQIALNDNKLAEDEEKPITSIDPPNVRTNIGVVKGYVKDGEGNPIIEARVELHSNPRVTYTDYQGFFQFDNVEIGDHKIFVVDERISNSLMLLSSITIKEGDRVLTDGQGNNESAQAQLQLSAGDQVKDLEIIVDLIDVGTKTGLFSVKNILAFIQGDIVPIVCGASIFSIFIGFLGFIFLKSNTSIYVGSKKIGKKKISFSKDGTQINLYKEFLKGKGENLRIIFSVSMTRKIAGRRVTILDKNTVVDQLIMPEFSGRPFELEVETPGE